MEKRYLKKCQKKQNVIKVSVDVKERKPNVIEGFEGFLKNYK